MSRHAATDLRPAAWRRGRPRVQAMVALTVVLALAVGLTPAGRAATSALFGLRGSARAAGSAGRAPSGPAQDVAVNGWGDGAATTSRSRRPGSGYAWRELAVLRPGGIDDASWTGYQCVSGTGRFAAVAVLPASGVNKADARDHGATRTPSPGYRGGAPDRQWRRPQVPLARLRHVGCGDVHDQPGRGSAHHPHPDRRSVLG